MSLAANKFGLLNSQQKLAPGRPSYPQLSTHAENTRRNTHPVQHLAPPDVPYIDPTNYMQMFDDKDRWHPIVILGIIGIGAWVLIRVLNRA